MIHSTKRESAVSPVIGTILLVAITVLLVAGVLLLTGGFDTGERKEVGMAVKSASGNDAQLVLYGGHSLSDLTRLEMIDQDSPKGHYVEFWNASTNSEPLVGYPYPVAGVAEPLVNMKVYDTRINVKGIFADGSEAILLVQPLTFQNVFASRSELPYEELGIFTIKGRQVLNAFFGSADLFEDGNKYIRLPSDVLYYDEGTGTHYITGTLSLPDFGSSYFSGADIVLFGSYDSQGKLIDYSIVRYDSGYDSSAATVENLIYDPNGHVTVQMGYKDYGHMVEQRLEEMRLPGESNVGNWILMP